MLAGLNRACGRDLGWWAILEAGMADVRMGVIGCAGRMGRMLVAEIASAEGCAVSGGTVSRGSAGLGQDIGELAGVGRSGLTAGTDAEALIHASDVLIDFTKPEATAAHAAAAASHGKPIVIGT